jgi:hypothetical protein
MAIEKRRRVSYDSKAKRKKICLSPINLYLENTYAAGKPIKRFATTEKIAIMAEL